MKAVFGIEREKENKLQIIEYENGNGDFHFHSQIELCFVDEGRIEAFVNNKTKSLNANEMSIALGFDTHVYIPSNYAKFTVIIIPPYICENFLSFINNKKIANPFISDNKLTRKVKEYISKLKKEKNNEIKQLGYIYLILGLIADKLRFDESDEYEETQLLSKLLFFIHDNYTKNITLSSIANTFGYNASYVSGYFKSCLDIGISQYINILRLKNAIELMRTKKHSITYCALESGFSSLRTFYRVFKSEFNSSPMEYLRFL